MNYKFPHIEHINDVLPHIENYPEIKVNVKDNYTVINYAVDTGTTFKIIPDDEKGSYIRRECRGLKFDNDSGKIICRPFHKFFNVNQMEETMIENINPFDIDFMMFKEDGSMIAPFKIKDFLVYGTKAGYTDTVKQMLSEIDMTKYDDFSDIMINYFNLTPCFEYVSPNNKIVLKYQKPKLVLTALRHINTGEYIDIHCDNQFVKQFITDNDIEVVKMVGYHRNFKKFIEEISKEKDIEGVVGCMKNGHRFKAKTDEYVLIHKAKEEILNDRLIIQKMIDNEIDDTISKLDEADRINVEKVISDFNGKYYTKIDMVRKFCQSVCDNTSGNSKKIALEIVPALKDKTLAKFIFVFVKDNKQLDEYFEKDLRNHLLQNIRFEEYCKWLEEKVE